MRAICSGRWGATLRFAWESQSQEASKKYLMHEIWYPRSVLKAALGCVYASASFTRILSKEHLCGGVGRNVAEEVFAADGSVRASMVL
jgi:hypothetical protein